MTVQIPMGKPLFFDSFGVMEEIWLLITVDGGQITDEGEICLEGDGRMILTVGLLPDAVASMTRALTMTSEEAKGQVQNYWQGFLSKVVDLGAKLPKEEVPEDLRQKVSAACESVAILIKNQQSVSGGVQAGYPFELAYVRDMSGTMRGMLSLGMVEEARKILYFWMDRFRLHGDVHNAEGMENFNARFTLALKLC